MAADSEQVTVSIRLFFTWVLCIYMILDKGCHILYVFGLNSTVCSPIVGVYLSIDQVSYDFMMDADLYNSFLLRQLSKVSSNLQCVLVYDTIFCFNLVCLLSLILLVLYYI